MFKYIFFNNSSAPILVSGNEVSKAEKTDVFCDSRGDIFYEYDFAYNGEKPTDEQLHNAIDNLKPRGHKYEMGPTIK
ncbi:hypothetical protein [Obesumbacterium proteus]|uniref:hypothetical protein n=1 Tax=Obesumbacterium proteus TaxID=82983 RepID=UPI001F275C3B|nr:hypothetical protein [Obesumbacterium proteus]MCE9886526.1 hypothetical protein [Obesumbacterium proteus]